MNIQIVCKGIYKGKVQVQVKDQIRLDLCKGINLDKELIISNKSPVIVGK